MRVVKGPSLFMADTQRVAGGQGAVQLADKRQTEEELLRAKQQTVELEEEVAALRRELRRKGRGWMDVHRSLCDVRSEYSDLI